MQRVRRRRVETCLLAAGLTGLLVAAGVGSGLRASTRQEDPAELFGALEASLRDASLVEIRCVVTSTGAVISSLEGTLRIEPGNVVTLRFAGSFAGTEVDLRLASDGERVTGEAGGVTFDQAAPPALVEALLVGFTRMGVLHNLAMLSAGQLPDHSTGGVRDWVQVSDFRLDADSRQPGRVVRFQITVDGAPAGGAGLVIDPETGEPLQRTQRVAFPGGEMLVLERYEATVVPATR